MARTSLMMLMTRVGVVGRLVVKEWRVDVSWVAVEVRPVSEEVMVRGSMGWFN